MRRSIRWLIPALAAASLNAVWAQHGHGAGPGAGNGAPPTFPAAAGTSAARTAPGKPQSADPKAAPTGSGPATSVADRVSSNPKLTAQLQPLLPAGATVQSAAMGFKNQGQFIAALHVSRNLNIPFDQLKAKMTGPNPESLGKAIHELQTKLGKREVRKDEKTAEHQADRDIESARLVDSLSTNTALAARAKALLPAGANLQTAASGFESARQLLLVAHAAHDLNIPFSQLKTKVTGTNPVSLRQAIQQLKPALDPTTIRSDLRVARQETKADLKAAS